MTAAGRDHGRAGKGKNHRKGLPWDAGVPNRFLLEQSFFGEKSRISKKKI